MLHFFNCVALTFAPYFILYQPLAEYNTQASLFAGLVYGCTQMAKILAMATFLTPSDGTFSVGDETCRAIVNCAEIIGMQFALLRGWGLSKYPTNLRIVAVGLGWAFTDSLFSNLIPLWIGARGMEFRWDYLEMAVISNLNIVMYMSVIAFVWLLNRRNMLDAHLVAPIFAFCALFVLMPSIVRYCESIEVGRMTLLLGRACAAAVYGLAARVMLTRYESRQSSR